MEHSQRLHSEEDPCEFHGCDNKGQPEVELPIARAQSWDAPLVSFGFERDSRSSHSSDSVMQKERSWRKKRRRPLSMELSNCQEPWQNEVSSFCSGDLPDYAIDRPNLELFFQLTAALLLCIIFAILSALDAKDQCLKHETYAVLQLVDDDNIQTTYNAAFQHESDKCVQMFDHVVLPTGVASCIAAFAVLALISCHNRKEKTTPSLRKPSLDASLQVTTAVTVLFLIILVLQTYNVSEIMLQPRYDVPIGDDDRFVDASNPYQSLAAVDQWGQVGDNANLYYLAWFSQGLIVSLVYQSLTASIRGWHCGPVSSRTARDPDWYNSLYRLRTRTGIWTAAGCSCVLIVASAQYLLGGLPKWREAWAEHPRKMGAWVSGYGTAVLCATAVVLHFLSHRHVDGNASSSSLLVLSKRVGKLPLKIEMVLALLLSLLLGLNAVFVTGVHGPAPKVGNLYYASWFAFLLCIRICLGCVEEVYNVEEELEDETKPEENSGTLYEAPKIDGVQVAPTGSRGACRSQSADSSNSSTEKQEKKRLGRVRGYFFLSIFSGVCSASAYDAASNQAMKLSWEQMYMVLAPFVVSMGMLLMFLLSLSKRAYAILSQLHFGGIISVLTFGTWLLNLVLTMHSEDSWAVNSIGEIEMANLYYFSWASILTAGIQMTSYGKALFRVKKLDQMAVVWVAIWKVCFVILGAGLHVWHTISDNCEFDEITHGAVTFCSRTILAITVALTGLAVGSVVVLSRFLLNLCPMCGCNRIQAHVEMLASLFLVFLFIAAVALITGIGGPGQSVGDLYYASWLAFWVSLSTFVSCFRQLNEEDDSKKKSAEKAEQPQTNGVGMDRSNGVLI